MRLVGSAAFKAVGTSDPRPAGSIPVHLRQSPQKTGARMFLRACAVMFAFVCIAPAGVARADAARPGNMESIVESVTPVSRGAKFDIVGADAFVRVRATRGHEVIVNGYDNEPFVKIDRNGIVWLNGWSTTVALSKTRYGTADIADTPPEADNKPPMWKKFGTGGSYAWHDHRVHWMSPTTPPTLNESELVQHWSIPANIDGTQVVVSGSLYLRSSPGSWWWLLAVPAFVGALLCSARLRRSVIAACAVNVAIIGAVARWGLPAGTRPTPTLFVLGLAGLVIANVAVIMRRQREITEALVASAAIAVIVAVVLGRAMVVNRFAPGIGDVWWVRASFPAVAGFALAVTGTAVRALVAPTTNR